MANAILRLSQAIEPETWADITEPEKIVWARLGVRRYPHVGTELYLDVPEEIGRTGRVAERHAAFVDAVIAMRQALHAGGTLALVLDEEGHCGVKRLAARMRAPKAQLASCYSDCQPVWLHRVISVTPRLIAMQMPLTALLSLGTPAVVVRRPIGGIAMLKKSLCAIVAATAMAGSALAADLPSRRAPPPAFVPPPVMTWTGLYIGVNGGGIRTNSNNVVTTATDFGAVAFPTVSTAAAAAAANIIPTRRTGFLAGGTWGYNWQWNQIVVGTEGDFQGVFNGCNNNNNGGGFGGFGGNNNNCGGTAIGIAPIVGAPGFNVQSQQTITRSLDYLSTSRVRAGFLITPSLLIYGTGGVAIGNVRVNSSILSSVTPLPFALNPGISSANYSHLRAGLVAGGGLEWMFLPDWSIKAEALYYDLGRSTLNQIFVSTTAAGVVLSNTGTQTTWRNNGVIARAGINYHLHWFDAAPVVARY